MFRSCLFGMVFLSMFASCAKAPAEESTAADEQAIQALYDQFSVAVKARNVDAIMALYAPDPDLVAFDAFPPRQYRGASGYRKAYEGFFAAYPGPVTPEISELQITTNGTLAFTSSIDRWVATGADGKQAEIVFRATNGLRKIEGKWLIAHEHVSVPVDPVTGQADFLAKP